MKLSCSLAVVVSLSGASAWVVPASQATSTRQLSALNAQKPVWMSAATAAVAGWVLSTQIVSATITPPGACVSLCLERTGKCFVVCVFFVFFWMISHSLCRSRCQPDRGQLPFDDDCSWGLRSRG